MTPPLGPLEFTGADIFKAYRASEDLVIPGEIDSNDALAIVLNRLLAERLEKYLKNSKGEYSSMSEGKRLVMMLRSALEKKTGELKTLLASVDLWKARAERKGEQLEALNQMIEKARRVWVRRKLLSGWNQNMSIYVGDDMPDTARELWMECVCALGEE